MRILIAAALAATIPTFAQAVPVEALDSGTKTIFAGSYDGFQMTGTATLTVLGGQVGVAGPFDPPTCGVNMTGQNTLNVLGGYVACVFNDNAGPHDEPRPYSTVNIYDGQVDRIQSFQNDAVINIFGGDVGLVSDSLAARTLVNLYGGDITKLSSGLDYGTFNFYGYGFQVSCYNFHEGSKDGCGDTNIVTGFWADGTPFSTLVHGDDTTRVLRYCTLDTCDQNQRTYSMNLFTVPATVPEPASAALLAAALMGIIRRRRNATEHGA